MRKTLFMLLAVLALGACSEDTTSPTDNAFLLEEVADLAYGATDMADPGRHFLAGLKLLPDSLQLSATQEAQIRSLITAFVAATKADMQALAAIHQQARAARAAGQSFEEIRAILALGDPIRARLHEAEQKLHTDILALLTPAQIAWLESVRPFACRELRLTDAQKTQITALIAAFQTENQADLDLVKTAFEAARAAHQAGATRQEVAAILQTAKPAIERLRAARIELNEAIRAVLTAEQLASGCFGPMFGHHHRR
jgi:Spy/CpxP family protein refolding chaperone